MSLIETPLDELTYRVNGIAMQVHNELKPGHREEIYQRRFAQLLEEAGLQADFEKRVDVFVAGELLGFMYLDLWVEQILIVECKAFPHLLTNAEIGQTITYLAATGSPMGMLYNFGRHKLEWKRILPPKRIQDWHAHLYRCIWTPPGKGLPPIESLGTSQPIQFSVTSPHSHQYDYPGKTPSAADSSASTRLSASPSAVDSSAPIRLSASSSAADSSAPTRLSASPSGVDSSAPIPLSAYPSGADSSAQIRLSASPSAVNSSAPIPLSASSSVVNSSAVDPSAVDPSAVNRYSSSGVSIAAGNRAVELMRQSVRATFTPAVLSDVGAFGGLYSLAALKEMRDPVLVASTDGVGTKVSLAKRSGHFAGIGQDIVNHCINDILVQGARPLFFLDYYAASRLDPEQVAEIVAGMSAACQAAGCALLGGETAEMPGVYAEGHFDVAGTIVGVVERSQILPRPAIEPGDVLIGLPSSGAHTNGYSLIRKIFEQVPLDTLYPELGCSLAEALLAPHRSYLPLIAPLLRVDQNQQSAIPNQQIKGLAHITGGGYYDNIPRVLPHGLGARIYRSSWPVPPLFSLTQRLGEVDEAEMYHVFNMGIGMIILADPASAPAIQSAILEPTWIIGEVTDSPGIVLL